MEREEKKKMIKLLSLFSGIGAFEKALENIGIDYELVNYCEIDKFASKSYSLIHNVDESKNLKDVAKVDTTVLPNDIDLITYGFPCQDISIAGYQKGFKDEKGDTTRSGLFFEALRIIEGTKPKVAVAENVKALTGKRFKSEFETVLDSLNVAGYNSYWKILNAKNYGVPQNRERVFIVSVRKDIDNFRFRFPSTKMLYRKIGSLLEKNVSDKYDVTQPSMLKRIEQGRLKVIKDHCNTITTRQDRCPNAGIIDKGAGKYRYLTEKECFRLMGFDPEDCDLLKQNGISMTQIYKQAGNSVVVDVLEELLNSIYKELLKDNAE